MATIEEVTFGLVPSDAPAPEWLEELVAAVMAAEAGDTMMIAVPMCSRLGCEHPASAAAPVGATLNPVCACHAIDHAERYGPDDVRPLYH